jgi:AcrR family transcriptional regulator
MSESTSLRERTRRAVAAEITDAAIDLFAAQGFEATTIEQIATAAGLSRRSFFRYFSTKEEVLLQSLDATGQHLASALAARPVDEAPWTALRRSFDVLVEAMDADPDRSVVLLHMLLASPALHGAHLAKQAKWQGLLTAALLARMGLSLEDADTSAWLRASSLAGSALACLEAAQVAWVKDRRALEGNAGRDVLGQLSAAVDEAMSSIHSIRS